MNNNQIEAFEKFKKLKVGACFMKMGTGKTRIAIELVNYNNVDLLIYITPFSTKKNIENEIEKWGINCKYEIIGYETISSSDSKYLELLRKMENKKCFIVADESIFIKNEDTKRFKRLCNIREKCKYALILNGTPITKNEWDLYNQMYFLSPLIIGMNREQFLNTFFKKITYRKKGHNEKTFYKFSEINAKLLNDMINPYTFECDLDFEKEIEEKYIYINYENEDKYYKEKENKLEEYIQTMSSDVIINMLTSLNVIASNYSKKNDKLIEYINGKRLIVFCNYLEEINYIKERCKCLVIIGKTKDRDKIIEEFKQKEIPLLMTYGVGAYSLNLQFCNEIVYSSINFDFGKLEQSKYRIKRLGQEKNIKYTYFLTNLGINKLILENIKRKRTLENLVKEEMMKGDITWLKYI